MKITVFATDPHALDTLGAGYSSLPVGRALALVADAMRLSQEKAFLGANVDGVRTNSQHDFRFCGTVHTVSDIEAVAKAGLSELAARMAFQNWGIVPPEGGTEDWGGWHLIPSDAGLCFYAETYSGDRLLIEPEHVSMTCSRTAFWNILLALRDQYSRYVNSPYKSKPAPVVHVYYESNKIGSGHWYSNDPKIPGLE